MFAAQHGIGENICVFCLTEPNNSDVRNYYICFPFGEIVCANAARMKKNGVTTATILSGYISDSLFFFFLNMQLQNIWLLTLPKLRFFICILFSEYTLHRKHVQLQQIWGEKKTNVLIRNLLRHNLIHVGLLLLYYLIIAPSCRKRSDIKYFNAVNVFFLIVFFFS